MCDYCNGKSWDYKWNEVPLDLGVLGKHKICVSISQRNGLCVELVPEGRDTLLYEKIGINFCPYCGGRLTGKVD